MDSSVIVTLFFFVLRCLCFHKSCNCEEVRLTLIKKYIQRGNTKERFYCIATEVCGRKQLHKVLKTESVEGGDCKKNTHDIEKHNFNGKVFKEMFKKRYPTLERNKDGKTFQLCSVRHKYSKHFKSTFDDETFTLR